MSPTPNLQTIADRLGLSRATVSRALRDVPGIAPATRRAVRACARELGYRPDAAARQLAGRRGEGRPAAGLPLALLLGHADTHPLETHDNYRRVLRGAEDQAVRLGYSLTPFWIHDPGIPQRRLRSILDARGIRGLLLLAMGEEEIAFPLDGFAAVTIRNATQQTRFHAIESDSYSYSLLAARELTDRHRSKRPGLLLHPRYDKVREGRVQEAFRHGLAEAGRDPGPAICLSNHPKVIQAWMRDYRPDTLLFRYEKELLVALDAADPRTPPACFALDRIEGNERYPGVEQPWEHMGREAVNTLIGALTRREFGFPEHPKRVCLSSRWVPDGER